MSTKCLSQWVVAGMCLPCIIRVLQQQAERMLILHALCSLLLLMSAQVMHIDVCCVSRCSQSENKR